MTSKSAPKTASPSRTAAQKRRQTMTKVVGAALAFALMATIAVPFAAGL